MEVRKFMRKNAIIYVLLIALFLGMTSQDSQAISDKKLNITINKEKMTVREVPIIMNDQIVKTDTPSFLYIDRTLVPARLIAENYGAKVTWNQPTETATINHKGKIVDLKINSQTARINGKDYNLDKYSTPRLVNFGGSSAVTMVPLTFLVEEVLGYETAWDDVQKAAYIKEKDGSIVEKPEVKPEPKPEPVKPTIKNTVAGASLENMKGKTVVLIKGTGKVKRNIMKLDNPKRLVIDLMDSELEGSLSKEFNYDAGVVKGVRMSQFVPDNNYNPNDKIVRIVLDMKAGEVNPEVKIREEGNNLVIEPDESTFGNIEFDKSSRTLKIKDMVHSNYSVNYDKKRDQMTISIPSYAVSLNEGSMNVSDMLVGNIETINRGNSTDIQVHFRRGINYNVVSSNPGTEIAIKFTRDQNIKKSDRIIVLDAGHGGTDPGTSSPSGTREKDIVLSVTKKVERKLSSLGYDVKMTRSTDIFIPLNDRPKFANDNFADIFVSIHANSAAASASGIETFVPRTVPDIIKKEQGDSLAKLIQEELISNTNAKDRKVKQANHAVTRQSKMAAVLVEIGFLTNPGEEALLKTDSYQEKLADGIVRGIERYFEIY